MGKAKRPRQKFHASAVKPKDEKKETVPDAEMEVEALPIPVSSATEQPSIFSGLAIPPAALVQKLPEFDARSTVTSKSLRGLSKKDKRSARHDFLMQKLETTRLADKAVKEKKKREETVVVGDMTLMADALPTLDLLMRKSGPSDREEAKPKSIPKEKSRQKQRIKDIETFGKITTDNTFAKNPFQTMQEHLRNKLLQGDL